MRQSRMLNKIIEFVILTLVVLICSALARATTVTGTLVDPTGQALVNANVTVEFAPARGTNGSPSVTTVRFVTDNNGGFTTTLTANNTINPSGSTYIFIICPNASTQCSIVRGVSIAGASQDVSATLNAGINPISVNAQTLLPKAYKDSEIPVIDLTNIGAMYWNVTDRTIHLWDGSLWTGIPSLNGTNNFTGTSTFADTKIKSPWLDARAFGCVGDWNGTTGTDNLPCLQAIDAAASVAVNSNTGRGRDIYFPVGDYWASDEFVSTNPLHFVCAGGAGHISSKNRDGVAFVGNAANKWIMKFNTVTPGNVTHTGPWFSGCSFRDATGISGTPGSGTMRGGVKFTDVSRWRMDSVNFEEFTKDTVLTTTATATRASNIITVNATAHGLVQGDLVQVTSPNDATFNTWAEVLSNPLANSFTLKQTGSDVSTPVTNIQINIPGIAIQAHSVITQGDSADAYVSDPKGSATVYLWADTATANAMSAPHIFGGDIVGYKIVLGFGVGSSSPTVFGPHITVRLAGTVGIYNAGDQGDFYARCEGYPLLVRPGTCVQLTSDARNVTVAGQATNVGVGVQIDDPGSTSAQNSNSISTAGFVNLTAPIVDKGKGTQCTGQYCFYSGVITSGTPGRTNIMGFTPKKFPNGNPSTALIHGSNGLMVGQDAWQYITSISRSTNILTFVTSSPVNYAVNDWVCSTDTSDPTNFPNFCAQIVSVGADAQTFTIANTGADIIGSGYTGKVNRVGGGLLYGSSSNRFTVGMGFVGSITFNPGAGNTAATAIDQTNGNIDFYSNTGLTVNSAFTATRRGRWNASSLRWEFDRIGSGSATNTDLTGELTLTAATTASYSFVVTQTSHPECLIQPQFNPGTAVYWVTYTGTASFTVNFSAAVTGTVSYICNVRN